MAINVHETAVRLGDLTALRKTRARFLRALLAENEHDANLSYWRLVNTEMNDLRADLLAEADARIEKRVEAIESYLDKQAGIKDIDEIS